MRLWREERFRYEWGGGGDIPQAYFVFIIILRLRALLMQEERQESSVVNRFASGELYKTPVVATRERERQSRGVALLLRCMGTHRLGHGPWRLRQALLAAFLVRQEGLLPGEDGRGWYRCECVVGFFNHRLGKKEQSIESQVIDWHLAHLGGALEAEHALGRNHEQRVGLRIPRRPAQRRLLLLLHLHVHRRAHLFLFREKI